MNRLLRKVSKGSKNSSGGDASSSSVRADGDSAARSLFNNQAAPPAYSAYSQPSGAADTYYSGHPQNHGQPQPPPQPHPHPPQNYPQTGYPQQNQQYGGNPGIPPPHLTGRESFPLPTANPTADDPYSFLGSFDTVLVVDDSGSMAGGRWRQAQAALASIVGIITHYDKDGIDVYFLNQPSLPAHKNVKSPQQVLEIFTSVNPRGATPTGQRLNAILKEYMARFKSSPSGTKPLNIIVITDGTPTDDVESVIVQHARKLDSLEADLNQVGIQFFQIGSEPEATMALKELDDALGDMKNVRDMVDTVPFKGNDLTGEYILKIVLGAIVKRLDRKKL